MKKILLATSALAMTASFAAAEVSVSGSAGAGSISGTAGAGNMGAGVKSRVWAGIDVNFSGSVTTDSGITVSVSEDIGGGDLADYADKEINAQTGSMETPAVSIAFGATKITIEENAIDDVYDDDHHGDIGVSTSLGGASISVVYKANDNGGAADKSTSYSVGYTMGDVALSVAGTDNDGDSSGSAMKWSATYTMGDMTLGLSSDNNGTAASTTEGSVSYKVGGGLSVSLAADDADGWDASATYAAGALTATYATDEASAWEADVKYDLGGGVSINAASDSNETSVIGINFSF
jgi:outer membrane protein OmpU